MIDQAAIARGIAAADAAVAAGIADLEVQAAKAEEWVSGYRTADNGRTIHPQRALILGMLEHRKQAFAKEIRRRHEAQETQE